MQIRLTKKHKEQWKCDTRASLFGDINDPNFFANFIRNIEVTFTYDQVIANLEESLSKNPKDFMVIALAYYVIGGIRFYLNNPFQAVKIDGIFGSGLADKDENSLNLKDFDINEEEFENCIHNRLIEVMTPSVLSIQKCSKFNKEDSETFCSFAIGLECEYYDLKDFSLTKEDLETLTKKYKIFEKSKT